ncbi:bpX5 domain-containing protein [Catellatospora tritici]|uniref:bpX5 domain-containing protein n=1 Tax=Catellatospora tritici TaxID=2851566 RepID=UPI001C2DAD59|nr:hypothetical protein [Catellatospora tritici]MBV1856010.1 hypothetical protein [Catellatospora tritici]
MTVGLAVTAWLPREPPLVPAAVLATGSAVAGLAARVQEHPAAARLRAGAGAGWLLVLGDQGDLPWAPQVRYLGWESGVLLPTMLRPDVPPELAAREARRRCREDLVVLLPEALLAGPLPRGPVDLARLRALETAR